MRKIVAALAFAGLLSACTDVQAPELAPPDGASLSRGPAAAPFQATSISATERHSCAIALGNSLYCWGSNESGQVGIGTVGGVIETPARVAGSFVQVSVGGAHSCALDGAGAAYCWGDNRLGTLGTGNTAASSSPAAVDTELRFVSIGAGFLFTCALTGDGVAYCWGSNVSGRLGTEITETCALPSGSSPCSTRPVAVSGGHIFTDLQVGLFNGCGINEGGAVFCWGNNSWGQLGVGAFGPASNPTPRPLTGALEVAQLSVGGAHMCALSTSGVTYCWGFNSYGQLGNGSTVSATVPTAVQTNGLAFISVVASDGNTIFGHSCATTGDGSAFCWGANSGGQLGVTVELPTCTISGFTRDCSLVPVPVETAIKFTSVDAGNEYSCAIANTKRAYCWGSNLAGALGNPEVETTTSTVTPVAGAERGRRPGTRPAASGAGRITDR